MKMIATLLLAASLMACGGKTQKSATPSAAPDNQAGQAEAQPEGTGGTTYGGVQSTPAAAGGGDTPAGQ